VRRLNEELLALRDTFKDNEAGQVLQEDVNHLVKTLVYDEQGQPKVKLELVRDLEVFFSAMLRKVRACGRVGIAGWECAWAWAWTDGWMDEKSTPNDQSHNPTTHTHTHTHTYTHQVQFVPVPRIAVTTPDFDFIADDVVLNIRELTPKQVRLVLKGGKRFFFHRFCVSGSECILTPRPCNQHTNTPTHTTTPFHSTPDPPRDAHDRARRGAGAR
jgi:hypothetical protein